MGWGLLIALFISFLAFYFLFRMFRRIMPLVLHGILGMAVFWALRETRILVVPIDIVTFLIAAFGGILGVIVVILLAFLGIPL
ncbi:TPA: hypothetical protein HA225_04690 [Candidatus Micrarchaeota archaeon]|nr:hypothetical protein [Candidatus Micrarchaeota archaeon]HIH30292.1 hypothetical protein [Candidatus Micrarchaeota archaeon]